MSSSPNLYRLEGAGWAAQGRRERICVVSTDDIWLNYGLMGTQDMWQTVFLENNASTGTRQGRELRGQEN